jgi:UDP-2,3-diacylglucosamine pyrophosphatase LpxH
MNTAAVAASAPPWGASPLRPLRYRTVWISDVHLGTRGCRADFLLDFLRSVECDNLFLVGDMIDLWSIESLGLHWPQAHNNVLRTILGKAKHDTKVVFVPGNHDELLRDFIGQEFGNVAIVRDCMHQTADGRRLLVMHGDEFDAVVKSQRWLALIGSHAYDLLLRFNTVVNYFRRRFGYGYWSLAGFLKHKVKSAVSFISSFEQALVHEARRRGADGVVCGHIHRATIQRFGDVIYLNDGDWVESCTALCETQDGTLMLVQWSDEKKILMALAPQHSEPLRAAVQEAA